MEAARAEAEAARHEKAKARAEAEAARQEKAKASGQGEQSDTLALLAMRASACDLRVRWKGPSIHSWRGVSISDGRRVVHLCLSGCSQLSSLPPDLGQLGAAPVGAVRTVGLVREAERVVPVRDVGLVEGDRVAEAAEVVAGEQVGDGPAAHRVRGRVVQEGLAALGESGDLVASEHVTTVLARKRREVPHAVRVVVRVLVGVRLLEPQHGRPATSCGHGLAARDTQEIYLGQEGLLLAMEVLGEFNKCPRRSLLRR